MANGRTIGAGDTVPASLLPFSILENHNLYFDQFVPYYSLNSESIWFFNEINGHFLSSYPIVTPILITPIYAILFLFLKLGDYSIDLFRPEFLLIVHIMEKLSASLIASISVIFVYLSLKELVQKKTAAFTAIIFAFATNTWAISSQGLWQHGMVELLLAASIYLIILNEKQNSDKHIIALGILSGLFAFNRPVDSILLIPIVFYILSLRDKRIAYYMCSAFLISLPFIYYNVHYFGSIFGGYNSLTNGLQFDAQALTRMAGLLISPNRGIFVYTPIIIFAILGYFKIKQISNTRIKNFFLVMGISILALLCVYGSFVIWWAGGSYGPRFLTGILPVLFIFLGLYLKDAHMNIKQKKNLFIIFIFSILLIWSIFVQFVGAFYYPNGDWNGSPNNVDLHPEKCWYWNDTQIMRSFNAGIISPRNCIKNLQAIANPPNEILAKGDLGKGWYGIEIWDGMSTRWMENDSLITIYSPENRTATLSLNALSFYRNRTLEISSNGVHLARVAVPARTGFVNVGMPMHLAKGENTIRLHVPDGCERPCDIKELNNPDSRCLSIAMQNVTVT